MNLIHSAKELSEVEKVTQNAIIVIDELIALIALLNKTASDAVETAIRKQ